jgi:hypothetical protein
VLNLAAFRIDEKTREMLATDPQVLLGWDGEDPGEGGRATWLFLDLLKGRVLHTCVVDGMDHMRLHDVLEAIRSKFQVTFIGFVTDKQGLIVKCVQDFYPGIPHQFDQFHFLNNQWKHAVAQDSNVYMALRKALNGLYIHKVNRSITATFKGEQRQSVREVFKPVDDDLQVMAKARNDTFKQLRGVWLYEKLREYVGEMERLAGPLDPKARFTRIFEKTREVLARALETVRKQYEDARLLFDLFQPIREGLQDPKRNWLDQQVSLDDQYKKVWTLAKEKGLQKDFAELTTFQAHKDATLAEVLGEWCRLWESYRPGLFQYVHFPVAVKTNNGCESAFSKQKQRAYGRVAKWNVAHLVETRGEAYLRVTHCDPEELKSDLAEVYSTYLVRQMREQQQYKIHAKTQYWRTQARDYNGCQRAIAEYYDQERKERDTDVQGRQKDED